MSRSYGTFHATTSTLSAAIFATGARRVLRLIVRANARHDKDQLVKRILKCRFYVRYVDDMVLLAEERATLAAWRGEIERFLRERLLLELRATDQEPVPVRRGIEFVGWKTWWNRRLPRRQALGTLR